MIKMTGSADPVIFLNALNGGKSYPAAVDAVEIILDICYNMVTNNDTKSNPSVVKRYTRYI